MEIHILHLDKNKTLFINDMKTLQIKKNTLDTRLNTSFMKILKYFLRCISYVLVKLILKFSYSKRTFCKFKKVSNNRKNIQVNTYFVDLNLLIQLAQFKFTLDGKQKFRDIQQSLKQQNLFQYLLKKVFFQSRYTVKSCMQNITEPT